MRILITGASGQLGTELLSQLKSFKNKESLTIASPAKKDLDLINPINCEKYVEDFCPDVLLNLAAYREVE